MRFCSVLEDNHSTDLVVFDDRGVKSQMKLKLVRAFHAVGQGAFYSEKLIDDNGKKCFSIVYDCGTVTNKGIVKPSEIISSAFKDGEEIDCLFISHFDRDHVSMIRELINGRRIKCVVLPLLPDEEVAVLQTIYRNNNKIGRMLLINPVEVFGERTAVVRVEPSDDEPISPPQNGLFPGISNDKEIVIRDPSRRRICLNMGRCDTIPSGSTLFVSGYPWCYIPYNYKYADRHKALVAEIKKANINPKRLNDAKYVVSESTKLASVYKSLKSHKCGDINENSMLVYSGPNGRDKIVGACMFCVRGIGIRNWSWHGCRPACVYSGDSSFVKVKVHNVYKMLWPNVGTVQIPHHGSGRSFSSDFLSMCNHLNCPISVGHNNRHGHPTPNVVNEILTRHSFPIVVDECRCSKFTQCISMTCR